MAAADVRDGRRAGRDHAHAAERAGVGAHRPRVPVRRARAASARRPPRGCWPGAALSRAAAAPSRAGPAPACREAQAGTSVDVIEIDARLQPRDRRDPHAARERQVRAGARALQGLHHRRGPSAHRARLRRAAQDAGGAAGPRRLRAGHHRPARHPGDRAVARAALRLPSDPSRPAGRHARAHPQRGEASRSSRPRCRRSCARPRARCATRSRCSTRRSPTATAASTRTPRRRCWARRPRPRCAPSRAALLAHDSAAALEAIDRAAREGEDLGAFARDVIELLRRALVLKAAPGGQAGRPRPCRGATRCASWARRPAWTRFSTCSAPSSTPTRAMRESPHPRVELEVAAVRATRRPVPAGARGRPAARGRGRSRACASKRARPPAPAARAGEPARRSGALRAARARASTSFRRRPTARRAAASPAPAAPARCRAAAPSRGPRAAASGAAASEDVATGWQRVVEEVMRKKPMLGAVLAQPRRSGLRDGELTIVVTRKPLPSRDAGRPRQPRSRAGRRSGVRCAGAERFTRAPRRRAAAAAAPTHPAVQAAIAEFEGEVVAVRPRPPEGEASEGLRQHHEGSAEAAAADGGAAGGGRAEEGRGHRRRRHGDRGGQRQAGDRLDQDRSRGRSTRTTPRCWRISCWPPATRRCASRASSSSRSWASSPAASRSPGSAS